MHKRNTHGMRQLGNYYDTPDVHESVPRNTGTTVNEQMQRHYTIIRWRGTASTHRPRLAARSPNNLWPVARRKTSDHEVCPASVPSSASLALKSSLSCLLESTTRNPFHLPINETPTTTPTLATMAGTHVPPKQCVVQTRELQMYGIGVIIRPPPKIMRYVTS